ncbi:class II glutamine amidotransferase [bacterium]|nr:class II glutamine amidotransferase [candidate division CSSED10-310 bacterium]
MKEGIMRATMTMAICLVLVALLPVVHGDSNVETARGPENCRLFGMITGVPGRVDEYQYYLDKFKLPTAPQNNGWSLSAYSEYHDGGYLGEPGKPMTIRSNVAIRQDQVIYNAAMKLITRLFPQVIIAHLRNASSGCNHIADPHPFSREFNGKEYLFIHNGGLWGRDLDLLIHNLVAGYAEPRTCPDSPIDSEYLFLFFLKIMEKTGWDEFQSLRLWTGVLRNSLVHHEWNAINAIVTDGDTLWAVRCLRDGYGFPLHFISTPGLHTYIVSTESMGAGWTSLWDPGIYQFRPGTPPQWSFPRDPDPETERWLTGDMDDRGPPVDMGLGQP